MFPRLNLVPGRRWDVPGRRCRRPGTRLSPVPTGASTGRQLAPGGHSDLLEPGLPPWHQEVGYG